jgi:hypothetical protein
MFTGVGDNYEEVYPLKIKAITDVDGLIGTVPSGRHIIALVCLDEVLTELSIGSTLLTPTDILPSWIPALGKSTALSYYCAVNTTVYVTGLVSPKQFIIIYQ